MNLHAARTDHDKNSLILLEQLCKLADERSKAHISRLSTKDSVGNIAACNKYSRRVLKTISNMQCTVIV